MSDELLAIKDRLQAIETRNRRVEAQKAWETSLTRKLSILLLTYFVMCLVFLSLESVDAWKNAIVPSLGFFLSTLSLPIVRRRWEQRYLVKKDE